MSLEYPGGPNVITSILTKGRQEVKEKRRIHGACFEDGRRRLGPVEGGNGKEAGCHCTVKERTVDQTSDLWSHKILTRLFMLPNLWSLVTAAIGNEPPHHDTLICIQKGGTWSTERLSHLPEITQLTSGESADLNPGSPSLEPALLATVYHMGYICCLSGVCFDFAYNFLGSRFFQPLKAFRVWKI